MVIFRKVVIIFLGRNTANDRFLDATNKENNKVSYELGAIKRHLVLALFASILRR